MKTYKINIGILFTLLLCIWPTTSFCWSGRVVDKDTGTPINDAVIVIARYQEDVTPLGTVTSLLDVREELSDKQGKFSISPNLSVPTCKLYVQDVPVLSSRIVEAKPIIFKPGYKLLVLDTKDKLVQLEKVPTAIQQRQDEVERVRHSYSPDIHETKVLFDMVVREEEFIEAARSFEKKIKTPDKPGPAEIITNDQGDVKAVRLATGHVIEINTKTSGVGKSNPRFTSSANMIKTLEAPSSSREDRIAATEALGLTRDQSAVSPLLKSLEDKDAGVRASSAMALGRLQSTRAIQPLIHALSDENGLVDDAAKTALIWLREPAVEPLIEALASKDRNTRKNAALALGSLKVINVIGVNNESAVSPLTHALNDQDENVRSNSAWALQQMKSPKATGALINALHDISEKVRMNARLALIAIGEPAIEPLLEVLASDDKNACKEAANALGSLKAEKAVPPLIILLKSSDLSGSLAAAGSLGNFSDHDSLNALISALGSGNNRLIDTVRASLRQRKDRIAEPLINSLHEQNPVLRGNAALTLAYMQTHEAAVPIATLLNDNDPHVRAQAVEALWYLSDSRTVNNLMGAWDDCDPDMRKKVPEILVKIGTASTKALVTALKSLNASVQWRAAWGLAKIKDPRAVDTLLDLLDSATPEVAWMTIAALGEIGDKRALNRLETIHNSHDPGIRRRSQISSTMIVEGPHADHFEIVLPDRLIITEKQSDLISLKLEELNSQGRIIVSANNVDKRSSPGRQLQETISSFIKNKHKLREHRETFNGLDWNIIETIQSAKGAREGNSGSGAVADKDTAQSKGSRVEFKLNGLKEVAYYAIDKDVFYNLYYCCQADNCSLIGNAFQEIKDSFRHK